MSDDQRYKRTLLNLRETRADLRQADRLARERQAEANNMAEAARRANVQLAQMTDERNLWMSRANDAEMQGGADRAAYEEVIAEREALIAKINGMVNEHDVGLDEWLEAKRLMDEVKQFADQVKPYIAEMERKTHAAATLAASNAVASEYWRDQYRALKDEKRGAADAQMMQAAARALAEEARELKARAERAEMRLSETEKAVEYLRAALDDSARNYNKGMDRLGEQANEWQRRAERAEGATEALIAKVNTLAHERDVARQENEVARAFHDVAVKERSLAYRESDRRYQEWQHEAWKASSARDEAETLRGQLSDARTWARVWKAKAKKLLAVVSGTNQSLVALAVAVIEYRIRAEKCEGERALSQQLREDDGR